ncbi:MAG TPA: flagellar hook-basal body complex protein [Gammaproteobacteria bacterium]|nr:flagellar hook-basal body complex protein [Gammaproteobacteria bacterium]
MTASVLYTAMTGLEAASYREALTAGNLDNADTTGYRAQRGGFRALPFQGPQAPAGADVALDQSGPDSSAGPLTHTGARWDVALQGAGWLVARRADGQVVLTRDGRLHLGAGGLLRTASGATVLGANHQPISLPRMRRVVIGADGTISGVPANQASDQAQTFNRLLLARTPPGRLRRLAREGFAVAPGTRLAVSRPTRLKQGYLEGSNVSAVGAMTRLISDTRSFQLQARVARVAGQGQQGLDALISGG